MVIKPGPQRLQPDHTGGLLVDGATNYLLASIAVLSVYYLALERPVGYAHFIAEDNWAEHATFVLWLIASASLMQTLIKVPEFRRVGHFGLAVVTFVIGMEEIAWGQRLFGFTPPEFFVTHNRQSELTLHNFTASRVYYPYIGSAVLVATVAVPALARGISPLRALCAKLGLPLVGVRHWPFLYRSLGKLYHLLGRLAEARNAYERALNVDTKKITEGTAEEDIAEGHFSLAMTLYAAGLPERAKEHVEHAVRITPKAVTRKNYSGWAEKETRIMRRLGFQDRPPVEVMVPARRDVLGTESLSG